jgi:hypothetical protein
MTVALFRPVKNIYITLSKGISADPPAVSMIMNSYNRAIYYHTSRQELAAKGTIKTVAAAAENNIYRVLRAASSAAR